MQLVGLLAAAGFASLSVWWLWTEVPSEDYVLLAEDERLARFSRQCSAEVLLPEDEPKGWSNWSMHSAVVLLLHGEVSPLHGWPKDPRPPPSWDCRPADLPRHWRINSRVHFQVVAEDGELLERSFDPELDATAKDLDEPWAHRSCAADQLTADGFKQAVLNGRRLAGRYGETLASATLEAYSVDTKPCLTTAVGSLLPLLPEMEGTVSIRTLPAAAASVVDVASQLRASDDLLARWCHHGSLPCDTQSCTTPAGAASTMSQADKHLCALVDSRNDGLAQRLRLAAGASRLTLLSLDVSQLAVHVMSLGLTCRGAVEEGESMRPPRGSMLLLERWRRHSDARWRVLWNGVDVSQELPCGAAEGLGCPEAALLRMLEGDSVPSNG